jgi:hypothetical protein
MNDKWSINIYLPDEMTKSHQANTVLLFFTNFNFTGSSIQFNGWTTTIY